MPCLQQSGVRRNIFTCILELLRDDGSLVEWLSIFGVISIERWRVLWSCPQQPISVDASSHLVVCSSIGFMFWR